MARNAKAMVYHGPSGFGYELTAENYWLRDLD